MNTPTNPMTTNKVAADSLTSSDRREAFPPGFINDLMQSGFLTLQDCIKHGDGQDILLPLVKDLGWVSALMMTGPDNFAPLLPDSREQYDSELRLAVADLLWSIYNAVGYFRQEEN
jgi:hypothetical protein